MSISPYLINKILDNLDKLEVYSSIIPCSFNFASSIKIKYFHSTNTFHDPHIMCYMVYCFIPHEYEICIICLGYRRFVCWTVCWFWSCHIERTYITISVDYIICMLVDIFVLLDKSWKPWTYWFFSSITSCTNPLLFLASLFPAFLFCRLLCQPLLLFFLNLPCSIYFSPYLLIVLLFFFLSFLYVCFLYYLLYLYISVSVLCLLPHGSLCLCGDGANFKRWLLLPCCFFPFSLSFCLALLRHGCCLPLTGFNCQLLSA